MNEIFNRLRRVLLKLKGKGFVEIIFSSTIVKAIMFLSAMFLPRFLSKNDYGSLSYAETMINYYLLLTGLGLGQATLKYCTAENDSVKKMGIFGSTLFIGTIFNIIIAFICVILFQFLPFEIEGSRALSVSMIGIPILSFIFQDYQFYLRSNFLNKKYAFLSVLYTLLYVGFQIILAITVGVNGVVFARYLAYGIAIIVCLLFTKGLFSLRFRWPEKKKIKQIIIFSITLLIGNFFSIAVVNNETLFVGNFFKDAELLSNFKVSTYILQICVFFVDAIMVFVLPYFAKNLENKEWLLRNFKRLFLFNGAFMSFVVIALFVLSKPIVLILWGESYLPSIKIMRILLLAAWFQTVFRAIPGNILAFIGEERYTLLINIITCIVHGISDFIIFRILGEGSVGVGLILAYLFSGLCLTIKAWRKLKYDTTFINPKVS